MIKRLEKQLEFEFMKKEEKSRRRFELMDSLVEPLAEITTTGVVIGLLLDYYLLDKYPGYAPALVRFFNGVENGIKYLFSYLQ